MIRISYANLVRSPLRILLLVVARPRVTLLIAALLCTACILLGVFHLPISTDQNQLFSRDVPFFRDFLDFEEKFPENDAAYVLLEPVNPAIPPPTKRWNAAADAIASRLRSMPSVVRSVHARVREEQLGDMALLFEDPALVPERLADAKRGLPLARIWAEPPGATSLLFGRSPMERFVGSMQLSQKVGTGSADAETAPFMAALAESWSEALRDPKAPFVPGKTLPDLHGLGAEDPRDFGYFYQPDESDPSKKLLLIQVYPTENYSSLTYVSEVVEAIRAASTDAARDFPEFRVGVTGRPALEADEMRTTDRDSTRAEILALSAVFLGMVVFLRSFWLALASVLSLCAGIALTFGWAALAVGELNLLSLVFFIALIGIGMDYFVQLLSRYRVEAGRRGSARSIWVAVFRQVAAPVTTACLGAAGAFLASQFTQFRGAAALGVIAGGGLILCLLSGFTVLPALLTVFPARQRKENTKARRHEEKHEGESGKKLSPLRGFLRAFVPSCSTLSPKPTRRLLLLPLLWVLALAAMLPFAGKAEFDGGLLNLQAPDLESVKLVRKLQTWSAVVLSKDIAALQRARRAVLASPLVAGTEGIADAYANADWLAANNSAFRSIQWSPPEPVQAGGLQPLSNKIRSLGDAFRTLTKSVPGAGDRDAMQSAAAALTRTADQIDASLAAGTGEQIARRLSEWQLAFVQQLRAMLARFTPGPIDVSRLPDELRTHLISADGTYALYINPKQDLWQREPLRKLVADIEERLKLEDAPAPTGIAVDIWHTTEGVQHAFFLATAYALGFIVLLVLVDLRNFRQTLLAISVLALGLPMLVAIMGLLGISWNFANFFGLPILIGAGHEYGVFMVHRYREALRDPRRAWRGWDSSDWALLLCAYVTSASFAFFWLMANHRGLKSLGLVMALGTACIYVATVAVLRPMLKWMLGRQSPMEMPGGATTQGAQ